MQQFRENTMAFSSTPTTLNLLSRILELEFGDSRLQHYGLFEDVEAANADKSNALLEGQRRLAAELAELIAQQGREAVVLLVGDSLLPLARSLAEEGRSINWIGSTSLLGHPSEVSANLRYAGADFVAATEPGSVDVLVYGGSIRYLDQMAVLSKSRDLLGESGHLLFIGEFLHDDSRIEYSALPNFSSFQQLSKRLGFQQRENRDLSASASRTLELVQPLLERHGQTLLSEGDVDSSILENLQEEFAAMRKEFAENRRGFHLCMLGREKDANYEWADVQFGDMQSFQPTEIADLFEKSFGVSFNPQLWQWKYGQGNGKCVVARLERQGDIVAHYGGAPRRIIYFGEESMAIQPCDVMVHPSIRKQYGKGSLFFEVAATFLEREIGNTVNHLLGFGFPNQKTMNISKRLGLYEKTDDFIEIAYPLVQASPVQSDYALIEYDPADSAAREELNKLWATMKQDYGNGIIGVRDADYMQHRYVNHPFSKLKQYRSVILRAESTRKPLAFAVLKKQDGGTLLMDLVCPVAAMKSAISILKQELSISAGEGVLRLWITSSAKDRVCTSDAIVNKLGIEIPCNSWNPGPSAELLYGAWWLTAGDMDFI